jgi:16S rRNA (guanine527-N7)-methyltransferase
VLDSLRAASIPKASDRTALDLGSGAGLPGVVVALACPAIQMTLVESQRRRVAFLELAVERLELSNVRLGASRVEELPEGTRADLCLSRAFGSPQRSWTAAEPYLSETGRLVYFAGGGTEFQAPAGVRIAEVVPPALESSGPLVIMAR